MAAKGQGRSWPGRVLIGLAGAELGAQERDALQHPATGGVVLFTRNYLARSQLQELTQAIREAARPGLLIAVDHEGGRVQRFREGFTRLPALAVLGRIFEEYPEQSVDLAYRHARVMATELLLCGVDLSFAPVLDLDAASRVIGDRAFSGSTRAIIRLGGHYLAGMHDAGMKTCGKHFPGHGSVEADTHVEHVRDERPIEAIEEQDLEPFRALLGGLDSVMMAHVVYSAADARPAGYSSYWVGEILRGKLGFQGIVFSDDLGMHAAGFAAKLPDRMRLSLEAGCDAVLVCDPQDVGTLYRELDAGTPSAEPLLAPLAGRNALSEEELAMVGEWAHWQESLEALEKSKWA